MSAPPTPFPEQLNLLAMPLIFQKPSRFQRGSIAAARAEHPLTELEPIFFEAWQTVHVLKNDLDAATPASIEVEIWSDTGRVFWIVKSKRELFRFELTIPPLEQAYYLLPEQENDFEREYALLLSQIQTLVRESIGEPPSYVQQIVIRDSDDYSDGIQIYPLKSEA